MGSVAKLMTLVTIADVAVCGFGDPSLDPGLLFGAWHMTTGVLLPLPWHSTSPIDGSAPTSPPHLVTSIAGSSCSFIASEPNLQWVVISLTCTGGDFVTIISVS